MEIRFFKSSETIQLQQGIHKLWGNNHVFTKNKNLLNYMFFDNPNKQLITEQQNYSFLGAWQEGVLIGLLGILPFVFNNHGKKEMGCCLTNWIVSPEHRTSGAGLMMLDKAINTNPCLILSLGINENVAKLYKMMRWNVLEDCPRWIGVLNKENTITKVLGEAKSPLRFWNEVQPVQCSSTYMIEIGPHLDEELWNAFYWKSFAKNTLGFSRDFSFIQWRYINYPFFNYQLITCKDQNGNYKGLAVVRIEGILENEKIGRIVEFIAADQDSAVLLANSIIEIDRDILFFDFYCISSISAWGLEAVGFKRVFKNDIDPFVVPTRFQPLDLETTNIMASMYTTPKLKKNFNFIRDNMWYITKGDSDQDRPN